MNTSADGAAAGGLQRLAQAAGFMVHWRDAFGAPHQVGDEVLRNLLAAMGLPAGSPAQIGESLKRLEQEAQAQTANLLVVDQGAAPLFPWSGPPAYRLTLESGRTLGGLASPAGPGLVRLAPLQEVGYHALEIGDSRRLLAVCPARCPSVAERMGSRRGTTPPWGVAAQIYSLRGAEPGCGGDYTLLARLAEEAARHGAAAVAISPVHSMFSAAPSRYSPYSPSNRLFLNAAYIDPAHALDVAAMAGREEDVLMHGGACADANHVNWEEAQPRRLRLLRQAYAGFRRRGAHPLAEELQAFSDRGGVALRRHAVFEALHASHVQHLGPEHGWQDWPPSLRDPASAAVAAFAESHAEEVGFHVFLQWLAHQGMLAAQQRALDAGMPIGLIADLAIGTDPRGSHAWSSQAEILPGVSLGAPPDLYQAAGQNWGLTAMSPRALQAERYASFISLLRAAFAVAGGLRIDHILGLMRMWVIAPGASAADGAYLRYPLEDMLRLLALEAWRNHAIVIGENLGTVPEGLNERLAASGILGMNVLWFQREDEKTSEGGAASACVFLPPSSWPSAAVSMTTTHDLPTVAGWWAGRDLYWRDRLSPQGAKPDIAAARAMREQEKAALWASVQSTACAAVQGDASGDAALDGACGSRGGPAAEAASAAPSALSPPASAPSGAAAPAAAAPGTAPPATAPIASILCYVASAPSPLFIAPLEDLLGMEEQPNLPGGHKDYPSWTQIAPLPVDAVFKDGAVLRRIAAIERGRRAS